MFLFAQATAFALLCGSVAQTVLANGAVPPPPAPEPISLIELRLPPIAPSNDTGACTKKINPSGTGCIADGIFETFQSGDFLPDGKHVLAQVIFAGAPATLDSTSIYSGLQVIIVKTDGTNFPNGDPWKCITCGVPAQNAIGIDNSSFDYPHAFRDGSRLLIGKNVLDCGSKQLTSVNCKPSNTFIYPIRWNVAADGSGPTGALREQRLHPDQVHLGFNAFTFNGGSLGQFGYFGRLAFNPAPTQGTPLAPRYDLVNVTRLYNPDKPHPISTDGSRILINPQAISVGEARGFNGDGSEVTYIGSSTESCNVDIYASHLTTGVVRRLTSHPEYCDPVAFSPDNKWMAIMDGRGSGRNMFIAGMQGIPPLVDIVGGLLPSSTRNNGLRRFFEPYLLDFYGDRGNYYGQKINGNNSGVRGSGAINDPEWNGMADPRWSPDSRQLAFWQTHTISPSCGGANPLPCYKSTEPGGRNFRMYVATFTSRAPTLRASVKEHSDIIPWGVPYVPGSATPIQPHIDAGIYTLTGKASGAAKVNITWLTAPKVGTVSVVYKHFSDDGLSFLDGTESVTGSVSNLLDFSFDWYSDITQSGAVRGTKKTSPGGYHASINAVSNVLDSNGTLITTLNGVEWRSPLSGT
ncbi:hypothetical protein EDB80DRAFT_591513 [Ilyonectria destructans]|nr:hypothetical protein EDB80DRAFT_591513 [Ilyonectria destructans]